MPNNQLKMSIGYYDWLIKLLLIVVLPSFQKNKKIVVFYVINSIVYVMLLIWRIKNSAQKTSPVGKFSKPVNLGGTVHLLALSASNQSQF